MPTEDDTPREGDEPRRGRADLPDDRDYRPRRRRPDDDRDGGEVLGGLIPTKNGMALAAYYCGVFSFIPCLWGTLSVLAVVFGFIGLKKAKRHPSAKGRGHAIAGIVCGGITALLGLVAVGYTVVMLAQR